MIRELYDAHRGQYLVSGIPDGDPARLDKDQSETVDAILKFLETGEQSSHWLSELTHMEAPWRDTREKAGLGSGERGQVSITNASMLEYYSSL